MNAETLVRTWFDRWTTGDFMHLPITDDFTHTSPFGTITGKPAYLDLVRQNTDKFLGQTFTLHDALYAADKACVRYTARQGDSFSLDVSEWYYLRDGLIQKIVAYYHIGEVRQERELQGA
ncbi:MAG: nuclear transport factor 2 family protein [Flavobacteriales bacterium]|nr:nuclear transport factor 2 family protein [Flavobacteriales bacterium]